MTLDAFLTILLADIATHASTLIGSSLAVVGTLGGVLVANRNNRRTARESREHEDLTRFHERRFNAYVEFLTSVREIVLHGWELCRVDPANKEEKQRYCDKLYEDNKRTVYGMMSVRILARAGVRTEVERTLTAIQATHSLIDNLTDKASQESLRTRLDEIREAALKVEEAMRQELQ